MDSPLTQLEGMVLESVLEDDEGLGLGFDRCSFGCFNPHRCSIPVRKLVGERVSSVSVHADRINLQFSNGAELTISMEDDDYTGPEAFVAKFQNGQIVVGT